ncbi:MAG: hypothetical protein IPP68_07185 [Elusimicrobia bacterium]|nr:hypothetical protein [Elusimicrobiota bacterium]
MSARETHGLEVTAHLPGELRRLSTVEAERVRSQILDAAVCRAQASPMDSPLEVPEGLESFAHRLAQLEERIRRLAERLEKPKDRPLPPLPLRLRPDGFSPLGGEFNPPLGDGDWVEVKLILPPGHEDPLWILGQATRGPEGSSVAFRCVAQDQADLLVRYLLHRQRLDQTQPAFTEPARTAPGGSVR